jgi:hypothetical protein
LKCHPYGAIEIYQNVHYMGEDILQMLYLHPLFVRKYSDLFYKKKVKGTKEVIRSHKSNERKKTNNCPQNNALKTKD